jgi:hypothetical protein
MTPKIGIASYETFRSKPLANVKHFHCFIKKAISVNKSTNMRPLTLLGSFLFLAKLTTAEDFLQLVFVGQNASSDAALKRAAADSAALLDKLVAEEGSGYDALLPGESTMGGRRERRRLRSGDALPQQQRKLPIGGCPSKCSNNAGPYCTSIGCANCGKCGRRLLEQTLSRQRRIESELTSEFGPKYCGTDAGCSITARIYRISSDGTLTLAD